MLFKNWCPACGKAFYDLLDKRRCIHCREDIVEPTVLHSGDLECPLCEGSGKSLQFPEMDCICNETHNDRPDMRKLVIEDVLGYFDGVWDDYDVLMPCRLMAPEVCMEIRDEEDEDGYFRVVEVTITTGDGTVHKFRKGGDHLKESEAFLRLLRKLKDSTLLRMLRRAISAESR